MLMLLLTTLVHQCTLCSEGGPDTSGPNLGKAYLAIKGQANIDPRIEGRIQTYLTNWYSWGDAMGPLCVAACPHSTPLACSVPVSNVT
jgi:hypothetical protein